MVHAFWHNPDDPKDFIARPIRLPRCVNDPSLPDVFVNQQHELESFADEVSCLLEVPRGTDWYGQCIMRLEQLTGREL